MSNIINYIISIYYYNLYNIIKIYFNLQIIMLIILYLIIKFKKIKLKY